MQLGRGVNVALACLVYAAVLVHGDENDYRDCGRSFAPDEEREDTFRVHDQEHRSFCTLYVIVDGSNPFLGGATLVQENVLLTLATLFDKLQLLRENEGCKGYKPRLDIYARCGTRDLQQPGKADSEQPQNIKIKRIHLHPDYNNRSLINDFALLVTEKPFQFTKSIGRACLPSPCGESEECGGLETFDSKSCVAVGHGKEGPGIDFLYSPTTQKANLPLVERNMCEGDLSKYFVDVSGGKINDWKLDSSHICAGGVQNIDTCIGDGGGPLYCKDQFAGFSQGPEKFFQVGVTAWGVGGCGTGKPGVYSKISDSMCWIDEVMTCNAVEQVQATVGVFDINLRQDSTKKKSVNGLTETQCGQWQTQHVDSTCTCKVMLQDGQPEADYEDFVIRGDDYE